MHKCRATAAQIRISSRNKTTDLNPNKFLLTHGLVPMGVTLRHTAGWSLPDKHDDALSVARLSEAFERQQQISSGGYVRLTILSRVKRKLSH
jgi:hypothetical protein